MGRNVLPYPATSPADQIIELHQPCPNPACGSSDAYCVYGDGHGYCFSCNKATFPNKEFELDTFHYEYLPWRGVSKETMRFYDVKTKVDTEGKPIAIGYKYSNDSYKVRNLLKDKSVESPFTSVGDISKAGLFGRNRFAAGSNKTVTITEGELDALSLYQVLRSPVVSVRSISSSVMDCTLDRSWLNSFERIYLAFDGDSPGRDGVAGVARLFDLNKVFVVKFPGADRKDPNDYIRAGEPDELASLWKHSRKYQPDNIKSTLAEFKATLSKKPEWGVPYPWPSLTEATYGMHSPESILITALEGVGKTEICHAIEHSILVNTDHNVGSIYIEEAEKRHLEALAGIQLQTPVHLPDRAVSDSQVADAIQEVVKRDDRLFVYSHFGSDDPDAILDSIRFLVAVRDCRFIILDHISMVVSGLRNADATKALDYLSTRLQMMLMELNFCLILVSHVNDDLLTRGSRNISKIANTWIHLTRNLKTADPLDVRTMNVSLFKNRGAWKTGPICDLIFDPVTWTNSELTNANGSNIPGEAFALGT
jgi:twinkle protein